MPFLYMQPIPKRAFINHTGEILGLKIRGNLGGNGGCGAYALRPHGRNTAQLLLFLVVHGGTKRAKDNPANQSIAAAK
jgi:hypothetical protein